MSTLSRAWPSALQNGENGESAIAALLARPDLVRSVHQPIVELSGGSCAGWAATVRIAEWVGRENSPWFRAAAAAGLSGHLAGLALQSSLRARATMPGERFVLAETSGRVLTTDPVVSVLDDEDDVGDVILEIGGPVSPGALQLVQRLRTRGMRFATSAGPAGLDQLEALAAWRPDVITIPQPLVRGIAEDPLRQALVALVVNLAGDIARNLYGGTPAGTTSGPAGGPAGGPAVLSPEGSGVLAEGVETLSELAALRDLGVRWAQGWLIGRLRSGFQPPSVDVAAWVRALDAEDAAAGL